MRAARTLDRSIAYRAAQQRGLVTTTQLRGLGLSKAQIQHRLSVGRLHAVHRGVYRVGHTVAPRWSREQAAVLACGEGAYLTGPAALAYLRCWRTEWRGPIDVVVAGRRLRPRDGIRPRSGPLARGEGGHRDGMPIASTARALTDAAGVADGYDLARAYEEARRRKLVRPADLERGLAARPRCRGAAGIRALLAGTRSPQLTRALGALLRAWSARWPSPGARSSTACPRR